MDSDVIIRKLETLMRKATHDSLHESDPAVIDEFCKTINDNDVAHYLATKVIALRIHSVRPNEAFLALKLLDKCMRKCGPSFHAEVGKFRFLNEMIKLVSPKYFGNRTASNVKQLVLQLLYTWSVEYQNETKFRIAFDMLKNQGVVKETPDLLVNKHCLESTQSTDSIFQDKEKAKLLQKLLQSKDPGEIQMANKLIKNMVREEERRSEVKSQHILEVVHATEAVKLLKELLQNSCNCGPEEKQVMGEIYNTCKKHYARLTEAASTANGQILEDILQVVDDLTRVFMNYDEFREQNPDGDETKNSENLLDLTTVNANGLETQTGLSANGKDAKTLEDIFSAGDASTAVEPLKPMNFVSSLDDKEITSSKTQPNISALDTLSEALMNEALPNRTRNSLRTNDMKKLSLNCLDNKKDSLLCDTTFDIDFLLNKQQPPISFGMVAASSSDDVMIDISDTKDQNLKLELDSNSSKPSVNIEPIQNSNIEHSDGGKPSILEKSVPISNDNSITICAPLNDINVTLDRITPSNLEPMTIFEDECGISVVLHFSKDKPRDDVNVMVVSTTSKSKKTITDYKFQAVVSKPCKVRHMEPSSTSLPAFNSFLPPPALTQIILLARPDSRSISLKYIISYICDGEGSTEVGTVDSLPLDKIDDRS